ncbi:GNAT family N-acetyltransferase [Pseudoalteromonas ostreae]|uniref:GNAT family N-acetyltransferase n=1 Tax=Pseudoalteromonas ostreae TaxID=2774154 RepID=UPI001B375210|nr:GNAT family N-acetyltransferase [Pseudoalteromonas ostreae]
MSLFSHRWLTSISAIDAAVWQHFFADNPFTDHAFLFALEQSQCVSAASGWQPQHLAIYQNDTLVALAPGYLKSHSYGEYVFDWAWAEAYQQHGLDYYPKWLSGSPFSPIEGQRLAIVHSHPESVYQYITQTLTAQCEQQGWSGWHINFCSQQQVSQLTPHQGMHRIGVQFQWQNQNYATFDDFLAQLTARKRKVLKKERNKIIQQNISIKWLQGEQITKAVMSQFCEFYQRTYLKRSGHMGYLNHDFFILLHALMADKLVIMHAIHEHEVVAATLSFKNNDTLYGRYWGAIAEIDCLHFELCYYQGIEYCIKHQLQCFHSGAQGEHKIARGFAPVFTHSVHAVMDAAFSPAIADYLQRERQHMRIYHQQCTELLPFKIDN